MNLHETVASLLRKRVQEVDFASPKHLQASLRILAKWRSQLIDNTVVQRHGRVVQAGPFAGMKFIKVTEGCTTPRLLGFYESELIPYIEKLIQLRFSRVINVGCAEGYYAVGFALRLPDALIDAYDISPHAQRRCAMLASLNGVEERVAIHGEFRCETLDRHEGEDFLLIIDIEGAEDEMLEPSRSRGFRTAHIVVECHENLLPGVCDRIAARFADTHTIARVSPRLACPTLPSWFDELDNLDQVLALWEWRTGPTPWLVMTPQPQ